jgi:hypothetical protein
MSMAKIVPIVLGALNRAPDRRDGGGLPYQSSRWHPSIPGLLAWACAVMVP